MKVLVIFAAVISLQGSAFCMNYTEKRQLREKVVEMFNHAYRSYMEYAFPADELMPLSCKGRGRGTEPSRGDIDDVLGNFSLTLIDTLDSLVVLGQLDDFEDAVRKIIAHVSFDTDVVVSVFETNIRVLGGLLGGHVMAVHVRDNKLGMEWYENELLTLAHDLGTRLLPAFNTSTGIPYPRVNLLYGIKPGTSRTGHEKDTCTACAGTMILEFAALSRLTGDPIFENKAHAAMNFLWKQRHRSSDLMGTVINIHNGDWVRRESGVGAGIDSYYEYMLKAYILLGDETYLDRFNKHYDAVMRYVSQGPMMVDVHMHKPLSNSRNFMDALLAFWPGLQVLKGDLKSAIETHEMLFQVIQRHNFLPEAFTTDFRVHWGQHPLRPEFLESTYFIHKATGDPYYLEVGKLVMQKLEKHARVPCGFAAIKDVTTSTQEDQMDSYVLAETFKYLYLLFSEREDLLLDIDDYLFTTEAHLLPLSLSIYSGPSNASNSTKENKGDTTSEPIREHDEDEDKFTHTCPNTQAFHSSNINYAHTLRMPLKNLVERSCPKPRESKFTVRRGPRLRAADFIAGNKDQLEELRRMGIRIATMKDGRVQLLHTASEAASASGAEDGMLFMQEMIDLSKQQQQEVQQEPRVIQLMSPPYFGNMVFSAGPAQFGYDLKNLNPIHGTVKLVGPFKACQAIHNPNEIRGSIAVMERGDCMFIDKARNIIAAGAIGGIVVGSTNSPVRDSGPSVGLSERAPAPPPMSISDHNDGTNSDTSPLFAMSGDGRTDVNIPMLFLFHHQGQQLLSAIKDSNDNLFIMMGYKAKPAEDVVKFLHAVRDKAFKVQEETSPADTSDIESQDGAAYSDVSESPISEPVSKLEAPPRDDTETGSDSTRLLLNKYMKKMKLGDIEVQIKENRQWNQQAESLLQLIEGPDKNKHISVQLDNLVTSETEQKISRVYDELVKLLMSHTNLHSLANKGYYLKALSDLVETAFTQGEKGLDIHSQATLDKLAAELRPKIQTDDSSAEGGKNEVLIQAVEVEEPKGVPSDTSHFYLSENDLNEEGSGRSSVVKKAPEWMNLQDGEVMVDEDGIMYVNDGYDFDEDSVGVSTLDDLVQKDHSPPLNTASSMNDPNQFHTPSSAPSHDFTEVTSPESDLVGGQDESDGDVTKKGPQEDIDSSTPTHGDTDSKKDEL